jgi:hypothetical protein
MPVARAPDATTPSASTYRTARLAATIRLLSFVTVSNLAHGTPRRIGRMTAIGARHPSYDGVQIALN